MPKRAIRVSSLPFNCVCCGHTFIRNSSRHKYCVNCKNEVHKFESRRDYYRRKEKIMSQRKLRQIKKPWTKFYNYAWKRCNLKNSDNYYRYGGRGIKFLLTMNDIAYLWFRDKAYKMKQPSLDRIDSDGNYEFKNCQFLELRDNIRKQTWESLLK